MFIDVQVSPAFYEVINQDREMEQLRHDTLNIHKNGTATLDHIFNQMNCAGLDYLCIHGVDYSSIMGGKVLVSNEEIHRIVGIAPDKFIGFACVDPFDAEAAEKLERAFVELKLSGLSLHPGRLHFYPFDERLKPIYDICEKYNKPIIFHCGMSWEPDTYTEFCTPMVFERLAASRPNLRICLGQFGWPWCREVAMLMLKYPNVYTHTGALYFNSAKEFYTQMLTKDIPLTWIDRSLRHQIMFGSCNPRFEQIRMAEAIGNLGLRESTVELIRGQNAVDFLNGLPKGEK